MQNFQIQFWGIFAHSSIPARVADMLGPVLRWSQRGWVEDDCATTIYDRWGQDVGAEKRQKGGLCFGQDSSPRPAAARTGLCPLGHYDVAIRSGPQPF